MAKSITSPNTGLFYGILIGGVGLTDFTYDQDLEVVPEDVGTFEVANNEMVIKDLLNFESYNEGFISSQIDNLTLTFNVSIHDFDLFKSKLLLKRNENYFIKTDNAFSVTYKHCYFECNIAQDTNIKNNARLDFNPSLIDKELEDFIIRVILNGVTNLKVTRIDIALDYNRDLTEYMLFPNRGLKKRYYTDGNDTLETLYLGSKQRLYRVYNKKKERLDNAQQVIEAYDYYWRVEVQVRNQYLTKIPNLFEGFYLRNKNLPDLDFSKLTKNMRMKIFYYLNAESPTNIFTDKQVAEIKAVIKESTKNTDIDLNKDYKLIYSKLFDSIKKYGVEF